MISNTVIDTILQRQTVREYTSEPLTDEELEALSAVALRAPSGRNSQPCQVRFLQNADWLNGMHIDFKNIVGWDTPVHTRSDKNPFYHNAPAFVFIFAQDRSDMAAGLMTENICIAAQSMGLGTCIVGSVGALFENGHGTDWRDKLGIPRDFVFLVGIAIGHPDEKPEMKPRDAEKIKIIK